MEIVNSILGGVIIRDAFVYSVIPDPDKVSISEMAQELKGRPFKNFKDCAIVIK